MLRRLARFCGHPSVFLTAVALLVIGPVGQGCRVPPMAVPTVAVGDGGAPAIAAAPDVDRPVSLRQGVGVVVAVLAGESAKLHGKWTSGDDPRSLPERPLAFGRPPVPSVATADVPGLPAAVAGPRLSTGPPARA